MQDSQGHCAAAVGVRRAAVRVVPRAGGAVHQCRRRFVPRRQFHQRVQPLVQMPAADVRPDVADLLLARAPNLLHVVEVFLDGPAVGGRFQDVADGGVRVGAEIRNPIRTNLSKRLSEK